MAPMVALMGDNLLPHVNQCCEVRGPLGNGFLSGIAMTALRFINKCLVAGIPVRQQMLAMDYTRLGFQN
jgi:hypothetical protein